MANVNNKYTKNIQASWRFVNRLVKCSKSKIETLIDGSGNNFSCHVGKVQILISHYEKLGTHLATQYFDGSWKKEVSDSVKILKFYLFVVHIVMEF